MVAVVALLTVFVPISGHVQAGSKGLALQRFDLTSKRSTGSASFGLRGALPFRIIYRFKGGNDGESPAGTLLFANGEFFGTTSGAYGGPCGTVFRLVPNAQFSAFAETVLHTFTGGSDGCNPAGELTMVGSNLYGATAYGGSSGDGTIFRISMTTGTETILYAFTGETDGSDPSGGLINVGSYLYGTTLAVSNGFGSVFRIALTGGSVDTLYAFKGLPDAEEPQGSLVCIGQYLYGATRVGGTHGYPGTVFAVPLAGGSDRLLYSFTGNADGGNPEAGLLNVGSYLYGTTTVGGKYELGTVFRVPLSGGSETVLHAFKGGYGPGADGSTPLSALTFGNGMLYGTTEYGGGVGQGQGTVYGLPISGGADIILHSFPGGTAGADPGGVIKVNGDVYGTVSYGGTTQNFGYIFKIVETINSAGELEGMMVPRSAQELLRPAEP